MWWNYLPKFKDQKVKDVFLFEERLDGGLRQGPAKCQCNQSEVTNIKYWCTSIVNHFSKKTVFEETKIFLRSAIQNLVCKKVTIIVRLNLIKLLCVHWKYWREQCILYAWFQKVSIAEIGSSIMPGVKMLRQNFVSASNKSPKDKRLRPPKISLVFFNSFLKEFLSRLQRRGLDFFPMIHYRMSRRQTYCLDVTDVLLFPT